MQVIEISPTNQISFKLPHQLTYTFKLSNLWLKSLYIHIVCLHPSFISLTATHTTIEPFQSLEMHCVLHWPQSLTCLFKSKIRVYVWELDDEETGESMQGKLFNQDSPTHNLHFQEIDIDVDIDRNFLQTVDPVLPLVYSVSRVMLPNYQSVVITQKMVNEVLNYCEKIGEVQAIYPYTHHYVTEFASMTDIAACFVEIADSSGRVAIFGIGCLPSFGKTVFSPEILNITPMEESITSEQQSQETQKFKENNRLTTKQSAINGADHYQRSSILSAKNKEKQERYPTAYNNRYRKTTTIKQSLTQPPKKNPTIKRCRSQQTATSDKTNPTAASLSISNSKNCRYQQNFQIRITTPSSHKSIHTQEKILNIAFSADEKQLYLLTRDCILVCLISNPHTQQPIKFTAIEPPNASLPVPMLALSKQQTLIFANQSTLYWVNLGIEPTVEQKQVQRKHIYAMEILEELNLLMVGGKNLSKLSYLGKTTNRTNIKVYSCQKETRGSHLSSYNIPDYTGESIVAMKSIATKPTNVQLLLVLTNQSVLYFLKVTAYNQIQNCYKVPSCEIGIQEIISINSTPENTALICMEKLNELSHCFKFIKTHFDNEKVAITTESVRLPVNKYRHQFRMGGKQGCEWISAIDEQHVIHWRYLQYAQCSKIEFGKPVTDYLILNNYAVFVEETEVTVRVQKRKLSNTILH